MDVKDLRARARALATTLHPVVTLATAGVLLLLLAAWVRLFAMGATIHMIDEPATLDLLALAPGDAIPPAAEAGRYVGPLEDKAALWQFGNLVDAWTRTGRKIDVPPPAHLVIRAGLDVPTSGLWKISAPADPAPAWPWKLWLDGEPFPAEGKMLQAGEHRLQLVLRSDAPAPLDVRIEGPGQPARSIPASWLVPEDGVPVTTWLFAALGLAALGLAAGLVAREKPEARPAILRAARAFAPVFAVLVAIVLGTMLRAHGRLATPKLGDTYDEFQEAWQGYSLVHLEKPIAWGFPPWQQAYVGHGRAGMMSFFGRQLLIVQPYMEHPPLFSLLVGIAGTLSGAKSPFAVPLGAVRTVPLLLSLLFYPLLYAIARRLHGREAAALACLLFAVAPPFVLVMRFAKGDLLAALLAGTSLWAGLVWRETTDAKRARIWMIVCGVAAGLAPLAKELGIFALALPPILLAPRRDASDGATERDHFARAKPALQGLGAAFGTLLLYPLYGAIVDWERFLVFLRIQGATRVGRFDVAVAFVETLFLNWKNQQVTIFAGGWIFFWLATAWAARGRGRLFAIVAFLYLAVLVAAVDGRWLYGWYELPLYIPLAACAGLFLWSALARPDLFKPLAFLALAVLPLAGALVTIPDGEKMHDLRLVIAGVGGALGLHTVLRANVTRRLAQAVVAIELLAFVALCIAASWRIDAFYPSFALGG